MAHEGSAYGLWSLVIINSAVFILFAFSFYKPKTKTDWRTLGAFSAFIVALFTEMYGFPLTIYLFSGWLSELAPGVDLFSHDAGHLLQTVLGIDGNSHFNPLHILSNILIVVGFLLISFAWRVLHAAQKAGELAQTGLYARVRHPQYLGFIVIMIGFLLQWPTLPTVVLFPILVIVYARLARREERAVRDIFGEKWDRYAASVPAFIPQFGVIRQPHSQS